MNDLASPPKVSLKSQRNTARLELMFCSLKFRQEVTRLRREWGIPLEGLEQDEQANASRAIEKLDVYKSYEALYAKEDMPLENMLDDPTHEWAHVSYWFWLDEHKDTSHRFYGEVMNSVCKEFGLGSSSWPRFMSRIILFNDATYTDSVTFDNQRFVVVIQPQSGKYEIEPQQDGPEPHINITLNYQVTAREWGNIFEQMQEHIKLLPQDPLNWHGPSIRAHAQASDLARAGLNTRQISDKMGGAYTEENIRKLLQRARQYGL